MSDLPPFRGRHACGRMTDAGTPCKRRISGFDFACMFHTTEQERELVEAALAAQEGAPDPDEPWNDPATRAQWHGGWD